MRRAPDHRSHPVGRRRHPARELERRPLSEAPWITGLGAVTAAGVGRGALWQAVRAGRSCFREVTRFDTRDLGAHRAALVDRPSPWMEPGLVGPDQELAHALAVVAAREALLDGPPRAQIGLVLGSNLQDRPSSLIEVADRLATELELGGPRLVSSTACASATTALVAALLWLEDGVVDAVLVGGADAITPVVFAGFDLLDAMGRDGTAPFSLPLGMGVGDGAAFLLIERAEHARSRGATAWAALRGGGLAGDAFDATRPHPQGRGVEGAARAALTDAGLEAVDYVNAHGTGTEANDAAEWRGLARALGPATPVSSIKGTVGHTQGAAGAVELVATLMARQQGELPPTGGFTVARRGAPRDPIPVVRPARMDVAMSCNSAFGGINAAVVVGPPGPRNARRRDVFLHGAAGWAGPGDTADLARIRGVDPHALYPLERSLAAVTHAVLDDAGLRPTRAVWARTGLLVGQDRVSSEALRELNDSVDQRGLARLSGNAFARALLVAPAGQVSMLFGVRGPVDVIAAGRATGGATLIHAAAWVAHGWADATLALAGDEPRPDDPASPGAAGVWVDATPGPVRVAAVAIARTVEEARGRVSSGARVDAELRAESPAVAASGLLAVVEGVAAIRAGMRRVLVTSCDPRALCTAVVLEAAR